MANPTRQSGGYIGPVVGSASFCGPCALSAVTGLPASTWPDASMSVDAMHAAATAHGGVPLPEKDRPIARCSACSGESKICRGCRTAR